MRRILAATVLSLCPVASAFAGTLASGALLSPLAPGKESRLRFAMPADFAPDQPVWLVYDLVTLSADGDAGEVDFEQSFEGVKTPLPAFYATLQGSDMDSSEPEELRRALGEELYPAYAALNPGNERVLAGRRVLRLPAPGVSDAPLLVSVERATGLRPLALKVTVGQGPLPEQFRQKASDSLAYKAGFAAGLAFFGWLVLRIVNRRRD
jgi:hypothetical protein